MKNWNIYSFVSVSFLCGLWIVLSLLWGKSWEFLSVKHVNVLFATSKFYWEATNIFVHTNVMYLTEPKNGISKQN